MINRGSISLLFLLSFFQLIRAQQNQHCGFDEFRASVHRVFQVSAEKEKHNNAALRTIQHQGQQTSGGFVYIIPSVVHIIQSDTTIEISDARVNEQIQVLNEDFRRMLGTNGFGNGVDTEIEFKLATIDPNGCPTTGINRIVNANLAWHDMANDGTLKSYIQWDPHMYLNIWVPEVVTGGILGYATFPDWLVSNPERDGIVINGQYFGRGFGIQPSAYDLGRTATHEVGHWIGLYHTFEGGCAGMDSLSCDSLGDHICDTPPTSNSNFGCPSPQNTCFETPDLPDQTLNYMDYTNDACMNMFTAGQTIRMHYYLDSIRYQLWSPANLTATGCDGTVSPGCRPAAQFVSQFMNVCEGTSVQFTDESTGPATSWNWSFTNGNPSASTIQNPVVTWSSAGSYPATLIATNAFGSDTVTMVITVMAPPALPLSEDFETGNLPLGWEINDQDFRGTWTRTDTAGFTGPHSFCMNHFMINSLGSSDDLISQPFALPPTWTYILSYYYSYKRLNAMRMDSLQVDISTDCGISWSNLKTRSGITLATVPGYKNDTFWVPLQNSDWAIDGIPLDSFAGEQNLKVRFRTKGHNGQALYLDWVSIFPYVANDPQLNDQVSFEISPNPSTEFPQILMNGVSNDEFSISVYTVEGKLIYENHLVNNGGQMSAPTGTHFPQDLPSGLYILRIHSETKNHPLKWVKP